MSADNSEGSQAEVLSEFLIDQELVRRWMEIEPTESLTIDLPRVSMDMLYRSIENLYICQMHTIQALSAIANGEAIDLPHTQNEVSSRLIQGVNALRYFQTLIMANATGSQLGADWQIARGDENER